jgi:hypothetical protein
MGKGRGTKERLICLGAALVVGGAGLMVLSFSLEGPAGVEDFGKITSILGFLIYVIGRIRHGKTGKAGHQRDTSDPGENS